MSERAPLPEVVEPPRGRVLIVAPHADDDVIGCGGTAARHADAGDPVRALVVFDGLAGDADRQFEDREVYVRTRRREARAGGEHIGIGDYEFWDYPEGHEPHDSEVVAVARRLAGRLVEVRPDVIYAPWIGEYHIDHHVVARIVRMAVDFSGFAGEAWGYEVWTPLIPTRIVDITSTFARKRAALEEHRSQFEYHDMLHKTLAITAQRAIYVSREARHGEAFAPLGPPSAHDAGLVEAVRREDEARLR